MNSKVFPRLGETSNCPGGALGRTVVALSVLLFGCSPEPRYKTLPASYWLKQIRDIDAANRYHAAHALGEMGPSVDGAMPALIKALNDPHATVRWEAVKALGKFGPAAKDAVPVLQKCVSDPEPSVRMAAEVALKAINREPIAK
jgi:HEAT repeat protein